MAKSLTKDIEMEYGAISLDTCVFERNGFKFFRGILQQLNQFKKNPVILLQTEVVHKECVTHIANGINTTIEDIDKALKSSKKHFFTTDETIRNVRNLLINNIESIECAERRLDDFYKNCGALIVPTKKHVNIEAILEMYFSSTAPFENKKDKKSEFPDAIALLSLESWAKVNNTKIIVVSTDNGWNNYCINSKFLLCTRSLSDALNKFVPHGKIKDIIKYIHEENVIMGSTSIQSELRHKLHTAVENSDPFVVARGSTYGVYEVISLKYFDHTLVKDDNENIAIKVIKILEDTIVIKIEALVTYDIEVSFNFTIKDRYEHMTIDFDEEIYSSTEEFTAEILLHFQGNFKESIKKANIKNIEVINEIEDIDLGFVGPNMPEWES